MTTQRRLENRLTTLEDDATEAEYLPAGIITILSSERSDHEFETVDEARGLIRIDGVVHKLTDNIRPGSPEGEQ